MEQPHGNSRDLGILKVDESGRLMLPLDSRVRQVAQAGETLVGQEEPDGSFRVQRYADVIREIQEYCRGVGDSERVWSKELLRDRREEAASE